MTYKSIIFFFIIFAILLYLHITNVYYGNLERYFKYIFIVLGTIAIILPGVTNLLTNGTFQDDIKFYMKKKYLSK